MAADNFSGGTWISHSTTSSYLQCPRLYYFQSVYRDPKTGHKIQIASPFLSLGSSVHASLEPLSNLPVDQRFNEPLLARFDAAWEKNTGKKGGFNSQEEEDSFKEKGRKMIQNVINNPGPLKNLSVKIKEDLPKYWLSESEKIILCGKVDWLEYLPETDSVHIIDFKTNNTKKEDPNSLQLPIYLLLVTNTQKRTVTKASYWYLNLPDGLVEKDLPDMKKAEEDVLKIAREIVLMRKLQKFDCRDGGCRYCEPFEKVLKGEGEYVGLGEYNTDLYFIPNAVTEDEDESIIL